MTSISAYKSYECPKCKQTHIEPIYGFINFKYPPPPNKKESDVMVCQLCAAKIPLNEFNYLGVKEKPRRSVGFWVSIFRKVRGVKPECSPVDLYPFLSNKVFDPNLEAERFANFGMKPEQYPKWYLSIVNK